ncbi:MAG: hypothetical protein NTV51_24955 [Verrucomicrobia bacterium]|nr:hypothetical protein [Verrucomicrobiota bacterium]
MKNSPEVASAETPYQIIAHISQLMDEAEAMLVGPHLPAPGPEAVELRSRLETIRTELVRLSTRTINQVVDGAKATDDAIRAHPYRSLAIALGAGVLLGTCLRRDAR